ncbi:hypothetical protein TNIN_160911 [Trichonephila inaurata madagascariensis]|uniref:Uncharacterized protein n=1 Tax=Trichonephila inaurata madagascariensis TaxID=2747483 RepID=A0A8X7CTG6_9ARAC|nr:hypothetical protein TNIN_160911 [Trichonephila inaurata madagascariensis]
MRYALGKALSLLDVLRYHGPPPPTKFSKYNKKFYCRQQGSTCEDSMAKLFVKQLMKMMGKKDEHLLLLMVAEAAVFFEEWRGDGHGPIPASY